MTSASVAGTRSNPNRSDWNSNTSPFRCMKRPRTRSPSLYTSSSSGITGFGAGGVGFGATLCPNEGAGTSRRGAADAAGKTASAIKLNGIQLTLSAHNNLEVTPRSTPRRWLGFVKILPMIIQLSSTPIAEAGLLAATHRDLREESLVIEMNAPRCRHFFAVESLRFAFTKIFPAIALLLALEAAPMATAQSSAAAKPSAQGHVSVGAAANLVHVLNALDAIFRTVEPQITVVTATGASGSLVAQIRNGAPFDVFLSADLDYPKALLSSGHAVAGSLIEFATGQLVLWTTSADLDIESIEVALSSGGLRKLAVANPNTAPYGQAAKDVLDRFHLWEDVQTRLVYGENVTQAAQFVETGNADAGFVSLSIVLAPQLKQRGRWTLVPQDWHTPLTQGAVITQHGANNSAAKRYLEFLRSPQAQKILAEFGYLIPGVETSAAIKSP